MNNQNKDTHYLNKIEIKQLMRLTLLETQSQHRMGSG